MRRVCLITLLPQCRRFPKCGSTPNTVMMFWHALRSDIHCLRRIRSLSTSSLWGASGALRFANCSSSIPIMASTLDSKHCLALDLLPVMSFATKRSSKPSRQSKLFSPSRSDAKKFRCSSIPIEPLPPTSPPTLRASARDSNASRRRSARLAQTWTNTTSASAR